MKIKKTLLLLISTFLVTSCIAAESDLTFRREFWSPRYHGELLNYCLYQKDICGMQVADIFCKKMGYVHADKVIKANNVGITRYVDGCPDCNKTKCKGFNCDAFKLIRCVDSFVHTPSAAYFYRERTYVLPRVDSYRVAWCYADGRDCGNKVANSFCRRLGYMRSTNFKIDTEVHATRELGNGRLCFGDECRGFSSITCYR